MMEVQIWVLTGLVTALFGLLLVIFKASIKRMDSLIKEVHDLNITVSSQRGDIERNANKNTEQDKRLNEHSKRIRGIEIRQAKQENPITRKNGS